LGVARRNLYLDRGDMVTTISESVRLIAILLRYLSKRNALKMVTDMEEEIGMLTENESLKQSISMARDMLE